jgi:hypothetical protein
MKKKLEDMESLKSLTFEALITKIEGIKLSPTFKDKIE